MSVFLRQSTAIDVAIGPFLDSADGVTPETGLTISQADVRLKKNAGAWAQVNDATSATHEEAGWYEKELDATDTNTVGRLLISIQESGALPVWHEFYVCEEAVFDALYAASAPGYLQPTVAARTLDVSAGGEAGIDWANVGSPTTALNLSGTNIDVDQVVASVSGAVGSVTGAVGSVTGLTAANLDATISSRASAASLATAAGFIDTEISDIQARLPAALVGGRIDASVGALAAAVITNASIANDAISDAKVAADVTIASVTGAVGSVTGAVGSVTGNVGGNLLGTLSTTERNAVADALLDRADAIEVGLTPRQSHRLQVAAAAGKLSGAATATATIRNAVADSKDRIVATVDASGNRTAVTTDVS